MVRIRTFGGGGGSRTPVRKQLDRNFSGCSLLFTFPHPDGSRHPAGFSSFINAWYGQSLPHARSPLKSHPSPARGPSGADGRLIKQQKRTDYCQLIFKSYPFYRGQAPRPAIPALLPPSKPVRPHMDRQWPEQGGQGSPPYYLFYLLWNGSGSFLGSG